MSGLPKGWSVTHAIEVADPIRGVSYKKEQVKFTPEEGFTAVLRANNIQDNQLVFDDLVYVPDSNITTEQRLRKNDIVIAMSSGSLSVVGKSAQVQRDVQASFGAFCGALRPCPEIEPRYLGLFLKSDVYRKSISNLAKGSNINNLKWSHFEEIPLPLAPLPEQKRIADKLDATLARVDACRERLARVAPILKRFRQSVLAAATSGQLTADWREQHGYSHAGNDNQELQGNTHVDWVSEALPDSAKPSANAAGIYREATRFDQHAASPQCSTGLTGSSDVLPFERLFGWQSVEIQLVASVGTGSTPLRSNEAFFASTGIPWVTSAATGYEFVHEASEFVTEAAIKAHRLKLYPIGTLLVAMYGEGKTRGQVAELAIEATINQACAAVVVDEKKALRAYVKLALQANYLEMRALAEGGNQPNLNLSKVKEFGFLLPPLAEQTEIVRRVETLFAFADRLEARLASATAAAERLTPSLLAKAFRGELVPQDPNDEPASELLKRLATQREVKKTAPKQKLKNSKRAPKNEPEKISSIVKVLRTADKPLSSPQLLVAAGYRSDSGTQELEQFFLELREALIQGEITVERSEDGQDWFSSK